MAKIFLIILGFLLASTISQVLAHPGGWDSNGGHYCRKNCAQYGLQDGEYHCHSATCTLPSQTQTPSSTPTPTPTSTTSPSQQASNNLNVQLSEIYPAPNSGEKEWVEVFNPNSQSVDLTNWKFEDAAGNKRSLQGNILPNSFAYFEYSSGWLNNNGDAVSLLDANSVTVESYSYSEISKGLAWAKDGSGNWQPTSTPTKGAANQITQPTTASTGLSNKSSKSTTSTKTTTPVPTTLQVLGKKSQSSGVVAGTKLDENFASPSLNLATISAKVSSPEAEVATSQKSNFGAIILVLGGLVILGSAAFALAKKYKWKL